MSNGRGAVVPAPLPAGAFLAERAEQIRRLGRAVVADAIEIGRLLTQCRERLPHGAWLPWLEREFCWTDRTALNFMRLYAMVGKSETVSDLNLPMRDLYLLAAPSTPEPARAEVIERAEHGETLHHDDVAAIIARHGEGPVLRAAKQLRAERTEARRAERIERLAEIAKGNAPLPVGRRFPIILADPSWHFEPYGCDGYDRAPDYQTMPLDEICALPVRDIATDPALLFCWSTSPHLEMAFQVIAAWDFRYITSMVWHKTGAPPGLGHFVRIDHEILLIARQGDFPSPPPSTRQSSVIEAPRREHSRKPDEVYALIEHMYPDLPKIELFARGPARPGWAVWGNEANNNNDGRASS